MEFDRATMNDREKVLYEYGLHAFIRWRSYRTLFWLSLVGNVVQWWTS